MNAGKGRFLGAALVAVTALFAGGADAAEAQLRVIPQVGLYAPVNDLGTDFEGAREIGKKESTLALGLAIEGGGRSFLGFRVGGMYGTASDVPVGGWGCEDCAARSTVLSLTGAAVLRPLPDFPVVRPYGLAGVGGKWYDFDLPDGASDLEDSLRNETKLAFQLGVGAELDLGIIRTVIELSDYISSYEPRGGESSRQHDMVLSVGWVLGGR